MYRFSKDRRKGYAKGGIRPGAGRNSTGRTSRTLTLRWPADIVERVHADADAAGVSISAYLLAIITSELQEATPPDAAESPGDGPIIPWTSVLKALEHGRETGPAEG